MNQQYLNNTQHCRIYNLYWGSENVLLIVLQFNLNYI